MKKILSIKRNNYLLFSIILLILSSICLHGKDKINNFIDFAGVKFEILINGESNRRYIWIHGDEKTAELLIRKYLKENHGTAFLINNKEREVLINGYMLDPNRIFTNVGVKKNLKKLNRNISKSQINKTIELISNDKADIQNEYFKKRLERTNLINNRSKFNYFGFHVTNPALKILRNFFLKRLVKNKNFIQSYLGKIYQ